MIEAYKAGVLSILKEEVEEEDVNWGIREKEENRNTTRLRAIRRGLRSLASTMSDSLANFFEENNVVIKDEKQAETYIKKICWSLNTPANLRPFIQVYQDTGNVYTSPKEQITQELGETFFAVFRPVLSKRIISKKALNAELHGDEEKQIVSDRVQQNIRAKELNSTISGQNTQREQGWSTQNLTAAPKGNPTPYREVEKFPLDVERRISAIKGVIDSVKPYMQYVTAAVGTKGIDQARRAVWNKWQAEKEERIRSRVYIVNQDYSYEDDFLPTFYAIRNKFVLAKPFVNSYIKNKAAWDDINNTHDWREINAALEKLKLPDLKGLPKKDKEILNAYIKYNKAEKNLRNRYADIISRAVDEISEYQKSRSAKKPYKEESTTGHWVKNSDGLYIIRQGTKEFYPAFLEFFVRSFMLPDFAYKLGRGLQIAAKKDELKDLDEQGKLDVAIEIKNEFRQIKDLFKKSEQAGHKGEIRLSVQMLTGSVNEGLWSEAFEMLSHTGKYNQWYSIISECLNKYQEYIKEVDKMYDLLAQMARMFDFTTPDLGIGGHSAGDAKPLDTNGKNMEKGKTEIKH